MSASKLAPIIQVICSGAGKLAFLLVNVLLYKDLSLEAMGYFSVVYAIAAVLATISECGLRGLLVREMAKATGDPLKSGQLLAAAIKARLLALLPYLLLGFLSAFLFLPGNSYFILILILFAAWFDSNGVVIRGALRAYDHIILDAVIAGTSRLALLMVTGFLYWKNQLTVESFSLAFLAIAFADSLVSLFLVLVKTRVKVLLDGRLQQAVSLARQGIHFTILAIIGMLYIRVGTLILTVTYPGNALSEVAALNLAARVPEGVAFLPIALMNAAIPHFARNAQRFDLVLPMLRKLELVLGCAGVIISIGLFAYAEQLILLLATPEYLGYATAFRVYAVTVFFSFLQYVYVNVMVCMNLEHRVTKRYGMVLILNIILNLLMTWKLGALGAVLAMLICEIAAVCLDLNFLKTQKISLSFRSVLIWGLTFVVFAVLAWVSRLTGPLPGMVLYWLSGGAAGLFLLLKTDIIGQHPSSPNP